MSVLNSIERLKSQGKFAHCSFGVIRSLCVAAEKLHGSLLHRELSGYKEVGSVNSTGDVQTTQDIAAHRIFKSSLEEVKEIALFASEEEVDPIWIGNGEISVSIDPFDGSRAFKYGIPAGTIFCLFLGCNASSDFNGGNAFASGFFVYSMSLELVLCVDNEVYLLRGDECRKLEKIEISDRFISVNISNIRKWSEPWQAFFSSAILSSDLGEKFNTRWFGSLVTHAKTVLLSGGIFAYPADDREGYKEGHLRLVYEAIPISLIFESVGGASSSGKARILDLPVRTIHDKTPLVFGERSIVKELEGVIQEHQGQ